MSSHEGVNGENDGGLTLGRRLFTPFLIFGNREFVKAQCFFIFVIFSPRF